MVLGNTSFLSLIFRMAYLKGHRKWVEEEKKEDLVINHIIRKMFFERWVENKGKG